MNLRWFLFNLREGDEKPPGWVQLCMPSACPPMWRTRKNSAAQICEFWNPQKYDSYPEGFCALQHITSTLTVTCSIVVNVIDESAIIYEFMDLCLCNLRVRDMRSHLAMCNYVCHRSFDCSTTRPHPFGPSRNYITGRHQASSEALRRRRAKQAHCREHRHALHFSSSRCSLFTFFTPVKFPLHYSNSEIISLLTIAHSPQQ